MRLIKKMDGAISIFLCLVLTSLIILSGFLIDGSRIRAGDVQAQAAAENSMRSALAGYDRMLKDLYGLFALSDGSTDSLNEEIEAYMNRTLMTELGLDKDTMGEKMYDYLKGIFTNTGEYKNVSFLNLFDYGIDEIHSESLYNLAQNEVLGKQIIDYMKYRGPRVLAGGFIDKLNLFRSFGRQSGTMKKKVQIDKDLDKIRQDSEALSDLIEYINSFSTAEGGGRIEELYGDFIKNVSERAYLEIELQKEEEKRDNAKKEMDNLEPSLDEAHEKVISLKLEKAILKSSQNAENAEKVGAKLDSLNEKLSKANKEYEEISSQYDKWEDLYKESKRKCEDLKERIDNSNQNAANAKESIINLIDLCLYKCSDAQNYINRIITSSKGINESIKNINDKELNDNSDFSNQMKLDLAGKSNLVSSVKLADVKKAVQDNIELLKKLEEAIKSSDQNELAGTGIPGKIGKSRDSVTREDIIAFVNTYLKYNQILSLIKNYRGRCNMSAIYYPVKKLSQGTVGSDPRDSIKDVLESNVKNKTELSDNSSMQKQPSPKEPDNSELVSKSQVASKDYSKEDAEYISNILKGYQDRISSNSGETQNLTTLDYGNDQLKSIIDNVNFKNNEENFSASGLDFLAKLGELLENSMEDLRDSMYINEYAMGNFKNRLSQNNLNGNKPEKDFSGILKSERKTHYDGEIEYIISGMKDQNKNTYAVEAQILLMRFALNTLAIYMDTEKVSEALAAAEAIAGFTVFGVPVIHTLILLGWAMAEAVADVKLIMDGGKVPVYKVKGDWLLDSTTAFKNFAGVTAGSAGKAVVDFGESKAKDLAEAAKEKIDKMVETKVSAAVDKAFAPLEHSLNIAGDTTEDLSNQLLGEIDKALGTFESGTSLELQKTINELAENEFNALKSQIESNIKNMSVEDAEKLINEKKKSIKVTVKNNVSKLTEKLKNEVNEASEKGSDSLKSYIDSLTPKTTKGNSQNSNNIIASMTSMGYQDYLRLFLLFRGNNTKLSRIADLIQLNMRLETGNSDFRLEECNTYIRLKATVSMKYLFMTDMLMPDGVRFEKGSRHRINLLVYQGY